MKNLLSSGALREAFSVVPDAGAVVSAAGTIQRLTEQLDVQFGLHASLQLNGEVLDRKRERGKQMCKNQERAREIATLTFSTSLMRALSVDILARCMTPTS